MRLACRIFSLFGDYRLSCSFHIYKNVLIFHHDASPPDPNKCGIIYIHSDILVCKNKQLDCKSQKCRFFSCFVFYSMDRYKINYLNVVQLHTKHFNECNFFQCVQKRFFITNHCFILTVSSTTNSLLVVLLTPS